MAIPENPNRINTSMNEVRKYIEVVFEWIGKDRDLQESMIDIVC